MHDRWRGDRLPSVAVLLAALACGVAPQRAAAAVPTNFGDALVASVSGPTAIAFTPDGRLLVTTQGGTLRVYSLATTPATLLATPVTFGTGGFPALCSNFERGLLGVAVDPEFAVNNYIYLFYTFNKFNTCPTSQPTNAQNPVNRVSRFVLTAGNVVNPASETILIDNVRSPNGNHNAGDLHFGKDGWLYVSTGDGGADYAGNSGSGGSNDASRDQHQLIGKILRVTRDGAIPPDNPFQGAGTARCNVAGETTAGNKCQETFAWGLRNPFRMAFDPNAAGTRFFINDVGQNVWEEIDLGQAGVDYGWNCREGAHANNTSGPCNPTPSGMVDPLFEYRHNLQVPGTSSGANCNSITGGAFVPNGLWPGYDGTYLFSDYVCGWIFRLSAAPPYSAADFATSLGSSSAVDLQFGPFGSSQALYYTTFAGGGQVRRVSYSVSGNNAPTAVANATPLGGMPPLNVTFDATGSSDPDPGNTLTYFWTFGDGSPEQSTTSLTLAHSYTALGTYTATLRARDNLFAFSAPVTVQIQVGNTAPTPSIATPAPGALFAVGQLITLNGSATDPEQGPLPDAALTWRVILHHDTHTHPFLGPVSGNNVTFNAPPPEDLLAATNSYLEVELRVTDAGGLTSVVTRDLNPRKVDVTLTSSPVGRTLSINGTSFTAPQTFTSWDAWGLSVEAPLQVLPGVQAWFFGSWSDGGAAAHTIVTPATPASYTATFLPRGILVLDEASQREGDAGSATAQVSVRLIGDAGGVSASADFASVAGGTATSGIDYQPVAGSITITPPATSATFPVTILGDTTPELNETARLTLSNPTNAFIETANAQVIIRDDEAPAADFNRDGKTDIAFRNGVTLANELWRMNGLTRIDALPTVPATVPSGWQIVGTADFDLDGATDLLWQNPTSLNVVLWLMDGATRLTGLFLTPPSAGAGWVMQATGDFNNDGWPDILFRNATSGKVVVWLMRRDVRQSGLFTTPDGVADLNWQIVGTGHFDDDGKVDILWRNAASGNLVVWLMDGLTRITGAFLNPPSVGDVNWRGVAVGDFNADGQADVLWRHALSGRTVVWTMDGLNRVAGTFTTPDGQPDLDWAVVGPR